ncbi:MAG: DUF3575 domain-containing protein [Bacteroidetes bacterium]|nr:DUF3575 domain-containing protein [Bacteroidota bacterium]
MKRTILLLVASCIAFPALAQENVIKLNLTGLAFLRASLGYERAFAEKHSGVLWVDFGSYSTNNTLSSSSTGSSNNTQKFTYSQVGINLEYRFYPAGMAPRRFFVGPYLVARNIGFKVVNEGEDTSPQGNYTTYKGEGKVNAMNIGGGVQLGYQFIIGDVFSIDLFGGLGYYTFGLGDYDVNYRYSDGSSETESSADGGTFNISGLLPRLGIALGVAF